MSRASGKRNNVASRSAGKVSSQGANAFAKVQGSQGLMGNTAKSAVSGSQGGPNIVIDIESDNLTYNQARSIRLQLQRDVDLLRNRVRMLQNEESRAMRKIAETKKKTKELQDLQIKNDNVVL